MSAWPSTDIARISGSDDLHVAPFREDGSTYGTRPGSGRWSSMAGSSRARGMGPALAGSGQR